MIMKIFYVVEEMVLDGRCRVLGILEFRCCVYVFGRGWAGDLLGTLAERLGVMRIGLRSFDRERRLVDRVGIMRLFGILEGRRWSPLNGLGG